MKDIKDGGPAFPEVCNNQIIPGMSLRDYFAGQALNGILGNLKTGSLNADIAMRCYGMADAMLKERNK